MAELAYGKCRTIKKIKISQDNFHIIQPLLVASRIFGLCPVYYRKDGSSYVLDWSTLYAGYSYLIIIIATFFAVFGVVNDMYLTETSIRVKDRKSMIITGSDISIVIIIAIFCIVGTSCRLRVFWKLLCCCNKIDSVIPLTESSKHRKKSIAFISTTLAVFTFIEIFDIIVWSESSENRQKLSYLRDYFGFYLLYYIIIVQEIFFWHLIFYVKIRISLLNEYLVVEGDQDRKFKNLISINTYLDTLNLFKHSKKADTLVFKKKSFLDATDGNPSFSERLCTLALLHKYICSSVESINSSVALGLLMIILSCLDHLIVTPYFLVKEIISNRGNIGFICMQISWIVTHISRLMLIVEPCYACLKESRRTRQLICQLFAQVHNIEEDRKSLEIFIMQLATNKIRFSCCGLFKINRSIITKVAGAVTTYLVILFQLNN